MSSAGGAGGFCLLLMAQRFEALFQHAARCLLNNVASDEGGSVKRALLLAPAFRLVVIRRDGADFRGKSRN